MINILFIILVIGGFGLFAYNVKRIVSNIKLGRPIDRTDNKKERIRTMLLVAFGQKKMFQRPIPAILHLFIYVAFVITQIELIEILVDGATGSHRIFREALGGFYTFMISFIEVLSVLALVATFTFLARRNLLRLPRFHMDEMTGWPKLDGNLILYMEFVLVCCIFIMNGADEVLHLKQHGESYNFTVSSWIGPLLFGGVEDVETLSMLERVGWWSHLLMVLTFLNYLPISKHFHIILAFPNVYYSNLEKKGRFSNMEAVITEVKMMFDPSADPYAEPPPAPEGADTAPQRFGAKDVDDLTWKSILDGYTCTECGRCSDACPANTTGKKLSPRKIMMDVRDRAEELGRHRVKNAEATDDGKSLLRDYVSEEEIWACTSCNACVQECPVNNDPLEVILELRRFLVMEESKSPSELTTMFTNVENNGAPWQFAQADRLNWANED